jgi:hypothetical protein
MPTNFQNQQMQNWSSKAVFDLAVDYDNPVFSTRFAYFTVSLTSFLCFHGYFTTADYNEVQ